MRTRWRSAVLLAVVFAAPACKDSTGTGEPSRFSGELSGVVSGKRSGPAFYEEAITDAGGSFSVFGFSADEEMEFGFDREYPGFVPYIGNTENLRPAVGTHQFGSGTDQYRSTMFVGDLQLRAVSGTMTISSSTENAVKGTFAVNYSSSAGAATFVGSFNATKCPDC